MSATTTADAMQEQGTREFEDAISGKGPKMPKNSRTKAEQVQQAELDTALEATFPASDPVAPAVPKTSLGAPKGRESVEPTEKT